MIKENRVKFCIKIKIAIVRSYSLQKAKEKNFYLVRRKKEKLTSSIVAKQFNVIENLKNNEELPF